MTEGDAKVKNMNLATKISLIAKEIGAIEKSGRNDQQGYNFIEYAVVGAKIREIQAEYGVTVIPHVESHTCDQVTNSKGATGFHYVLNMLYTVINAHNPEDRFEARWLGEATDYGDKGINKAETSAEKYFLMRLYHISEKGEQEADAITPPKTKQIKAKIDPAKICRIRGRLPLVKSVDELETFWKKLNLDPAYQKELLSYFGKRKKELTTDEEAQEANDVE